MQWMRTHGRFASGGAFLLYIYIVLAFGNALHISANYFVILPVFAISMSFGFWGGLAAGICGLPANLLLFAILGHPEYSPESKLIAEISGIAVGAVSGFLSDYFYKFQLELARRTAVEKELRVALEDKNVLLKELHHRVKNNLNIILSLARLHSKNTDAAGCKDQNEKFVQRIYSIALVHDLLFHSNPGKHISFSGYITDLTDSLLFGTSGKTIGCIRDIPSDLSLDISYAVPVGMIINEVLINSIKHGFDGIENPEIYLSFRNEGGMCMVTLRDNGRGFDQNSVTEGLGSKLIPLLVKQVGGSYSYSNYRDREPRGTVFSLSFPSRAQE